MIMFLEETLLVITATLVSIYLYGIQSISSGKFTEILWATPIILIIVAVIIYIKKQKLQK
ncbi:hypothetical protein ACIQ4I_12440 [Rummeliibacillus sp. NPDC094406]|uniref:hypothetical protein n=1 Tax=Rummeliibacillus sp. NPDC094406 TaxID=3364511 RepID=UPI003803958F